MDENNEILENPVSIVETTSPEEQNANSPMNLYQIWYLIGGIFFIIMIVYLFQANDYLASDAKIGGGTYSGMNKTYVGGDAYNYIIAGTYSTTIMVRSLIFAILGSISFLMGKISEKKI